MIVFWTCVDQQRYKIIFQKILTRINFTSIVWNMIVSPNLLNWNTVLSHYFTHCNSGQIGQGWARMRWVRVKLIRITCSATVVISSTHKTSAIGASTCQLIVDRIWVPISCAPWKFNLVFKKMPALVPCRLYPFPSGKPNLSEEECFLSHRYPDRCRILRSSA
jgi:hypothetical protein